MQSELTPEKRAELRAKAEAATPGIREVAGCEAHRGNLNSNCRRVRLIDGSVVGPREEDMQHFAAFDRETCLALLDAADERDRLRAENAKLRERLREAVAEERESCAKIADLHNASMLNGSPYDRGWSRGAMLIASAIRQREGETTS